MGCDFAIEVEARQPSTVGISDEDVERHYRVHVPPGEPPLVAIREHVMRAIALERGETDPIDALHRRFVDDWGRFAIWFDSKLATIARQRGVTELAKFQRDTDGEQVVAGEYVHDSADEEQAAIDKVTAERQRQMLARGPDHDRWCDAGDGLRTIRALQAEVSDRDTLACLACVEEILAVAEREHRRWRLLAMW